MIQQNKVKTYGPEITHNIMILT